MPVFLFNSSDRKMHGVFEAVSCGQMNINPHGWVKGTEKTPYSAQVRVKVKQRYPLLPESTFKKAFFTNFYTDRHFCFELDSTQTSKLCGLFAESTPQEVVVSQNVNSCNEAVLPNAEEESEQWHTTRSAIHAWNKAVPYSLEAREVTSDVWEGLPGSDVDISIKSMLPNFNTSMQPAVRTHNEPLGLSSGQILSSHGDKEPNETVGGNDVLQQQKQQPETCLNLTSPKPLISSPDIRELEIAQLSRELQYLQTWGNSMLQQQNQQQETMLNSMLPKPCIPSSDSKAPEIAQLLRDLQHLQTLVIQRGSQQSMEFLAVQKCALQGMINAWEHKESAEKSSLEEQAMQREEFVKQRESVHKGDFN